jgi:nitrogen regulatory protein PII
MSLTKKPRKIKTAESGNTSVDNGFKKLKLLVTVVNRSKTELFMDFLTAYEVNFQASVLAQGTAHSDMLYMLGLEDSDKSVIFSVVREEKVNDALQMLEEKFQTIKHGKGIAFTIPMSSVIGVAIYRFLSNHRQ